MTMKSGEISSTITGTPPKKKNAASQWSKRNRITHPLLEMEASADASTTTPRSVQHPADESKGKVLFGYNTPPRHCDPSVVTPALTTCSPDSPALVDALKMAARPSPSRSNNTVCKQTGSAELPQTSYSSSIEAMAAYVEASRVSQRKSIKRMHTTKHKRGNGSDTSTSSSSVVGINKQSSYSNSTNKPLSASSMASNAKAARTIRTPKSPWMVPIIIVAFCLLSEVFLGVLVFCLKDSVTAATEGTAEISDLHLPPLSFVNIAPLHKDELIGEKNVAKNVKSAELERHADETDSISLGSKNNDLETDDEYIIVIEKNSQSETDNIYQFAEFKKLQSLLEEGFDGLKTSITRKGGQLDRKSVESTCGNVWVVANDYMNSGRANSDIETETILNRELLPKDSPSDLIPIPWESLALDAQKCLGGAGLAFLDKNDLDMERLRLSTQIFDRLSTVRPFDPDVRAGLGTCLLIQGIFHEDDKSTKTKAKSPMQSSLLSLATYHLKVAASLSSSPQSVGVGLERDVTIARHGTTKSGDEHASYHAAILHNLALAYLAVGDSDSSVLFLLQAAAIRRDNSRGNDTKPYWNAPDDVLKAAELKTLLVAAKPNWSLPTKQKGTRTPFLPQRATNVE